MLIKDVIKFVQNFTGVIDKSTPHLYLSGLPFLPFNSVIGRYLVKSFPGIARVAVGLHDDWPRNEHILQGHTWSVNSVAFSPDGRHIVSGSIDGTIQLWKAQTDQVAKPLQEQSSSVTSDRMVNVSDSEDNTSAQTGGEVDNPLQGHTWSVNSVAFSPDGRYIVSGSVDGAIQLWETQSGGQVADSLQENTSVNSAAFSQYRKDNWLDSWDKAIKVWGAQMGGELCDALNEQSTAHALHDAQSLFDDVSNFNGDYQDLIHLQHDGWIVGPNGKLFLWVPPSYCKYFLYTPWTRLIIPKGKI